MSKQVIMYVWQVSLLPVFAFIIAIYWKHDLWNKVVDEVHFKPEIIIYVIILLFWTIIMLVASTVMMLSNPKKEDSGSNITAKP